MNIIDLVVIVGGVDNVDKNPATLFCPYMWDLLHTLSHIYGVALAKYKT
jgi:hypothetical protein